MNAEHNLPHPDGLIPQDIMDEIRSGALAELDRQYDHPIHPGHAKYYHISGHSLDVESRGHKVLRVVEATAPKVVIPRDYQRVSVTSLRHDAVLGLPPVGTRLHTAAPNEFASMHRAELIMRAINYRERARGVIFTEEDIRIIKQGIRVTSFIFAPNVTQHLLNDRCHIAAKATAIGDLSGASIGGPAQFYIEGNRFFQELNMDLTLRLARGDIPQDPDEQEAIKARIYTWSDGQVDFAKSRLHMLGYEISLFPRESRRALAELMRHLPDCIRDAENIAVNRREMPFIELLRHVGYAV